MEDNLVNQRVACQQLKKFGTQVWTFCGMASNAWIPWKSIEMIDYYDLILMDVQMPVLDGLQATRKIRESEKEHNYAHKPIIGLNSICNPRVQGQVLECRHGRVRLQAISSEGAHRGDSRSV